MQEYIPDLTNPDYIGAELLQWYASRHSAELNELVDAFSAGEYDDYNGANELASQIHEAWFLRSGRDLPDDQWMDLLNTAYDVYLENAPDEYEDDYE